MVGKTTLELTVAYLGLVMVFTTWGIDKAEVFENNRIFKKIIGIFYIFGGSVLAAMWIISKCNFALFC